jgi:DNA transformation protein
MPPPELARLRNLGAASARMLVQAGIADAGTLRRLGSVGAYRAVLASGQAGNLNLLWAIEGALSNRDWREVARSDKLRLLLALESDTKDQR